MTKRRMPAEPIVDGSSAQTAQRWKKASLSYSTGDCVEVADGLRDIIRIRDSKTPGGVVLGFAPADWTAFVGAIRQGKFDRG